MKKTPQENIEDLISAIESMIDAKISLNRGVDAFQDELYQARANMRESLALLLNVANVGQARIKILSLEYEI